MTEYLDVNKTDAEQFPDKMPGYTWMKNFMKWNWLAHKKAEMISAVHKSNASNPFIINDFYKQLE